MSSKPAKLGQPLSPREMAVCELLIEGKSSKAIGFAMGISPKTVSVYKVRIYEKMGVHNAVHLCRVLLTRKYENAPEAKRT